jgi:uncharacterized membrane protein
MDSPLITAHDLRLLSIGYYIQGGIAAFYTLLMLGYSAFASAVFAGILKSAGESSQQEIPPALVSIISLLLAIVLGLACAYTACLFLAGYWLRHSRNMLYLQILAALNCIAVPYGTVLGIFTFMVLQRPTAKQIFRNTAAPPLAPTPPSSPPPPITTENPAEP